MGKHILFIPSWFSRHGVDGMFIREHARMTAQAGHQIGLIYVQRGPGRSIDWWLDGEIRIGQLTRWHPPKLPVLINVWKQHYLHLYRAYVQQYGKPDLLHAHGYVGGIATAAIRQYADVPMVLTEHSTNLPADAVPWYHRNALRNTYRQSNALIAVSAFLRDAMQQYSAPTQHIHVIGNPVDLSRFTISNTRHEDGDVHILSIGSLDPRKNFDLLLRAMGLLKGKLSARVTIIGSGPLYKHLMEVASREGIDDIVSIIPQVTQTQLFNHLHAADMFVSTSVMENFGVAIAEALACGIPVVASQSGGPEGFITPQAGILVPVGEAEALALAIMEIATQKDRFVATDIRNSVVMFDFPVIAALIDHIYEEVSTPTGQ